MNVTLMLFEWVGGLYLFPLATRLRTLWHDGDAHSFTYRRLHLAPAEAIASRLVLQDVFVPAERAAAAVAFCRERLTAPPCAIWL